MYATDFEFAGEKLSDYGLIICDFNNGGLETVSSGADIKFNQEKPSQSNYYFSDISNGYEESYAPQPFQVCRNPCLAESQEEMYLSPQEVSALQRWLCRKKQYQKFKIKQENYEHIFWKAKFSAKQIEIGGNIIGLELTMTTDAPFAYTDEINIEKECTDNLSFEVYDFSDEEGFIYPDISITFLEQKGDTAFALSNTFKNEEIFKMHISNFEIGETITINGRNQIIETSNSNHVLTLPKDFDYSFPKIANTYEDNKNIFTCNLKCKISLSYSPIIKVGL